MYARELINTGYQYNHSRQLAIMNKFFLSVFVIFIFSSPALATDPPMQLYDEGAIQGTIFKINCSGSDIACSRSGITGTIQIGTNVVGPGATPGGLTFLGSQLQFNGSDLAFNP